jgi:hypothetical protein
MAESAQDEHRRRMTEPAAEKVRSSSCQLAAILFAPKYEITMHYKFRNHNQYLLKFRRKGSTKKHKLQIMVEDLVGHKINFAKAKAFRLAFASVFEHPDNVVFLG